MRIIRVVVLLATLIPITCAWGQDQWGMTPRAWLDNPSPTVRSWGMGFTGVASWGSDGPPNTPAALGLWAPSPRAVFGHKFEQIPTDASTPTDYDVSSSYAASGSHWSLGAEPGDVRLGLGIRYREIRYRWGPASHTTMWDETVLLVEDGEKREWSVGIALCYGVEFGLGIDHSVTTTTWTPVEPTTYDDLWSRGDPDRSQATASVLARVPVFHTLGLLGIGDTVWYAGPLKIELTGALGSYSIQDDARSGASLLADVQYNDLPLVVIEGSRDVEDHRSFRGLELTVGGFYSYRAGDWNFRTYIPDVDGTSYTRVWMRWPTRGYAIHSAGLARWIAHLVQSPFGHVVRRVADHVDLFYETAWFPDSENRPPGFGDVRAVEWGISLTNLDQLW